MKIRTTAIVLVIFALAVGGFVAPALAQSYIPTPENCYSLDGRVGHDENRAPEGFRSASNTPDAHVYYLVAFDTACLRANGVDVVDEISIYWHNPREESFCTPIQDQRPGSVKLLWGATSENNNRKLQGLQKVTIKNEQGVIHEGSTIRGWTDYDIPNITVPDVEDEMQVVVGVEFDSQWPGECPIAYDSVQRGGVYSYLLLAEGRNAEGNLVRYDCNMNGTADVDESLAYPTRPTMDLPLNTPCKTLVDQYFYPVNWKIRVKGHALAEGVLPPFNPGACTSTQSRFDTNRNDIIDDVEFFAALDQWLLESISNTLFFNIVDSWTSQVRLSSVTPCSLSGNPLSIRASTGGVTFQALNPDVDSMQLEVIGLSGQRVHTSESAGNTLRWNRLSTSGVAVPNGVYFGRVTLIDRAGNVLGITLKKFLVLR